MTYFRPTLLGVILLLIGGGCKALTGEVDAKYPGLEKQQVGIMVWADRALEFDYPNIREDIAAGIQKKLTESQAKEVAGVTYPISAQSIVNWQREFPQISNMRIEDVAPKLAVTRLIYVEVKDLTTRGVVDSLFRGHMTATIRVLEINGKTAKTAFSDDSAEVIFPPKTPAEGISGGDNYRVYLGTVDAFNIEVANMFTTHYED